MNLRARLALVFLAAGGAAFACAQGGSGRDLAAGWRGLLAIRGARLGEPERLPRAPYADAVFAGRVETRKLVESSGLALSRRNDDLLWSHNDSGRKPRLFAFGFDGRDRGAVLVNAPQAVDWESLASFEKDGRAFLVVADTGDNMSWRRSAELLVIEEPLLSGERFAADATAQVAWRIPFRFEDGPRDCEALAIDPATNRALLLSKRTERPALYELSLEADTESDPEMRIARRLGDVRGIPPPTRSDVEERRWLGRYASMPTGLDISADGRYAAVVTYKDAYLFARHAGEAWEAAFGRPPQRIPLPPLPQAEGVAFGPDRRGLFVTSEKRPTPLFRFDWRGPDVPPRESIGEN
jgi:hypothetical protein